MPDFFTVSTSFIGLLGKEEVTYVEGEVVPASDPALRKWPEHFTPLVVRGQVEQATAAPGEKRGLRLRGAPNAAPEPESAPAGKPVSLSGLKGR